MPVIGQVNCITSFGAVYGSPGINEEGHCIVPAEGNDGVYIAGSKGDSVLLMRVNNIGKVVWSRTFDIVPGGPDIVYALIRDSDGMLACTGASGNLLSACSVFAFQYNPLSHLILWAEEYESAQPRNFGHGIIQLGIGGNYIIASNPTMPAPFENDLELIVVNRNNGNIIPGVFPKNYHYGGSEALYDMIYKDNFIYGVGRYTDGLPNIKMRHTLVKIDPVTGKHVWAKMGHIAGNGMARLYGSDLVIDQDEIFSVYHGDQSSNTTTRTRMYIQKSTMDGNLVWLNQYDLPGMTDHGYEIIQSDGGYVVMAGKLEEPKELVLFKIDNNGSVLWAKTYLFTGLTSAQTFGSPSQLIQVGNQLWLTGWGIAGSGTTDLFVLRTDLQGEVDIPCVETQDINIPVIVVANPSFYSVTMTEFDVSLNENILSPLPVHTEMPPLCFVIDTLTSLVQATICHGNTFEGYSAPGTYEDYFMTNDGCDSLRTLELKVDTLDPTMFNMSICEGASYLGYSATGIYRDTFQTKDGCDSVRILDLDVFSAIYTDETIQICLGDSYQGHTTPGIYRDTLIASGGCDSVVTLQLTVTPVELTLDVEICTGGHFENYSSPGIYVDTLKGISIPCDTVRQINLSVLPMVETSELKTICAGENYFGYHSTGNYSDTLISPEGCISIQNILLTVKDPITTHTTATVCDQNIFSHTKAGIYVDTLVSVEGCDSIRTLEVEGVFKYIPNVFSPNQDGINDLFEVIQFPEDLFELQYFGIFDRLGNMTYETTTWPIVWEGNGKDAEPYNPGVFAYVIIYQCGKEKITETGDITLIR